MTDLSAATRQELTELIDRQQALLARQQAVIAELETTVEQLQTQVRALEARLAKGGPTGMPGLKPGAPPPMEGITQQTPSTALSLCDADACLAPPARTNRASGEPRVPSFSAVHSCGCLT